MSKGMWTKQYAPSGKKFYYNATQNISVWNPPPDAVIHEAPNLKTPAEIAEELRNEEAALSFAALIPEDVVTTMSNDVNYSEQSNIPSVPATNEVGSTFSPFIMDAKAIQDKINQAVSKSQSEALNRRRKAED